MTNEVFVSLTVNIRLLGFPVGKFIFQTVYQPILNENLPVECVDQVFMDFKCVDDFE